MVSPSCGTGAPSSSTSRVCTPASGRPTHPGRRSPSARVLSVISDSVLPYRSTGRCPVSRASFVEHRNRQRRTARHQQPCRRQRQRRIEIADHPRPHRRHPEVQRAVCGGIGRGCGFSGVHEAVSDAQRAEQPQHQTVHVEQRKAVHEGVVGRPLPGLGERVDVGGDGPPAQHHALGRAGGAGGVHDQRGGIRRRLGVAVPRPGVQPHRDVRQAVGLVGPLPQPRLRAGVGEDVAAFGGAHVGGNRDGGHTGDQATGDRQHRRGGRRGQHRHPLRAADPFGHRRRGADQVAAAQHGAVDAHRVADIGTRRRRPRGSARPAARQGGYPQRHSAILGQWIPSGVSRPARCTATTG